MLHRSRPAFTFLALSTLMATCQGLPPDRYEAVESEAAAEMLEIDFTARPPYLEKNVIVLTFDDGPDSTYTTRVLDILKEKNVKASFFINTINNANVDNQPAAQNLVKRIVNEGHELATHTVHHIDLAVQSESKIEEEIVGVENSVRKIFGDNGPKMTLLRAPFGRPYQSAAGSEAYKKVSAVVAKHAVHIGWAIDSNDWMHPGNADRVFSNVTGLIKKPGEGAYGVVLMHSINPQTVGALPRIIDYINANGFVFKLTEDVVRARFGQSSAQLLGMAPPGGTGGAGGTGGGDGGVGNGGSGGAGGAGGSGDGGVVDAPGAVVKVDAKPPSNNTGGSGGGQGRGGNGGQGDGGSGGTSDPVEPPRTARTNDGSCSYGSAPQPAPTFVIALAAAALLRRRRRR